MALVRDSSRKTTRKASAPALAIDPTLEQSILPELHALRELLEEQKESSSELKGQVRELRTVMMGDGAGETPFGRLPLVEGKVEDHAGRLKALEKDKVKFGVYGGFLHWIGMLLAGAIGTLIGLAFGHK